MMRTLSVGLALGLLTSVASAQAPEYQRSAIPGWTLALQCWTFHDRTLLDTLDLARDLGLQYIECYPGQKISDEIDEGFGPGLSEAGSKAVRDKLNANNQHIVAFGVTGIPGDEAGIRSMFAWAQSWGIRAINTEIGAGQFELVDPLAEEYGLKIGIHNHPKPSHYWDPAFVASETEGFDFIGACADTGHWPRSDVAPLDGILALGTKINGLHFKDLNDQKQDAPWGTGTGDALQVLRELHALGFKGTFSIEYEVFNDQRPENVKACGHRRGRLRRRAGRLASCSPINQEAVTFGWPPLRLAAGLPSRLRVATLQPVAARNTVGSDSCHKPVGRASYSTGGDVS